MRSPRPLLVSAFLLFVSGATLAPARERHVTFKDRIDAQRAVERVYHAHQQGARRPFDEAVPASLLESKVRNYLKQSAALELWGTPITAEMLRAEAERMAGASKMPDRLRELYAALDDDAVVIQECLVRPALVDRLVRERFESDPQPSSTAARGRRPGGAVEATVTKPGWDDWWSETSAGLNEWDVEQVAIDADLPTPGSSLTCPPDDVWNNASLDNPVETPPKAAMHQMLWTGSVVILWDGGTIWRYDPAIETWTRGARVPVQTSSSVRMRAWTGSEALLWGTVVTGAGIRVGLRYNLAADSWASIASSGGPSTRLGDASVWTGSEMIIWGGNTPNNTATLADGARYNPATDTWTPVSNTGAPAARWGHSAVWTGSLMIVWGGYNASVVPIQTGSRYNPATDTWSATPIAAQTPGPRTYHAAIWTGQEMIVSGGASDPVPFAGRYDPVANTWQTMAQVPSRYGHSAIWTGTRMIVFGGSVPAGDPLTNAIYDPGANTWTAASLSGAPQGRLEHAAVWTDSEMLVHGGRISGSPINSYGRYAPSSDSWTPGAPVPRFRPRSGHVSVWTGSLMIVWGGNDTSSNNTNTGARYDPALDVWSPTALMNAPAARFLYDVTWTGDEMIVWGSNLPGGRYDPVADAWAPVSTVGQPPGAGEYTMVWTGSRMIVWGGGGPTNQGGLYDPVTDTWTQTSLLNAPSPRYLHTAVWTGSRMIVWGGCVTTMGPECSGGSFVSGGIYDPATDTWAPTAEAGAPAARARHTAVWTDGRMIVWGGDINGFAVNTGGVYDPSTGAWTPTSTTGAPGARRYHTAVWTGTSMVIWGGGSNVSPQPVGSRYNPVTKSWAPVSVAGAPVERWMHTSVWTGAAMIVWGGSSGVAFNDGGIYGVDADLDADADGVGACHGDCDDTQPAVYPGAPQICGDGLNNDCLWGSWPALASTNEFDSDGDGLSECMGDCNDSNAQFWSTPGEVRDLDFAADQFTLVWTTPADPGGVAVRYDSLRSPTGTDFGAPATCVETDDYDNTSTPDTESPDPGSVFFYLVRAENFCPGALGVGPLGQSSAGVPRTGRTCP